MLDHENTFLLQSLKRRRESLLNDKPETADAKRFKYLSNGTEFLPIQNISSFTRNNYSSPASNPSSASSLDLSGHLDMNVDAERPRFPKDSLAGDDEEPESTVLFSGSDSEEYRAERGILDDGSNSLFSQSDSESNNDRTKSLFSQSDSESNHSHDGHTKSLFSQSDSESNNDHTKSLFSQSDSESNHSHDGHTKSLFSQSDSECNQITNSDSNHSNPLSLQWDSG
jgi:hypothetical protein